MVGKGFLDGRKVVERGGKNWGDVKNSGSSYTFRVPRLWHVALVQFQRGWGHNEPGRLVLMPRI